MKDLYPTGFSYEKDTRLYFDDTCVVPERLEGKIWPQRGLQGNWGSWREMWGCWDLQCPAYKAKQCWHRALESC